ncbi:FadR/GntR family transcriptional regulator [Nocardioides nitrophenolicus]|uniref:FadR/GntR family transcriptional regulator n=1 Tax=Nocardioides nitrophenolicus TaxID=60489 RepID=UPI0019588B30|nr:GntR family transcriptional regulator [Nocardioides nitrophenolicus]MBM7517528.1 DNA-binding FadR family transcriptional regulator [Nocardioides nitrophenolicus]
MALRPVTRRSVSDQVVDQLLDDVVDGELAAGDPLPSERRLAEVLGISRPAVREALQRIAQTGLVEMRHGGATVVRDFRRAAGLDLLPRLLVRGGQLDTSIGRSVIEARAEVGPGIAALAAERGGPALAAGLEAVTERMAATTDAVEWQVLALDYWDVLVDGADSMVFRLMFNSLRAAYEPALPALATVLAGEVGQVEPYLLLAAAVRSGDAATARAAAARVLIPTADTLLGAFAAMGDDR